VLNTKLNRLEALTLKSLKLLFKFNLLAICFVVICLCGCSKEDKYKDLSAKEIYDRGTESARKKNYSQAVKDFDALEARYPYGEYTDRGQLALMAAYINDDNNSAAIATADRFIRMHPRYKHLDYVYYTKGVANFNDNFTAAFRVLPLGRYKRDPTFAQQGFDDFKTLLEKYPDSQYAPDARKRMIFMREQLANHELDIAKYYEAQGADLAAANRAGYIVNNFPRTTAAPKALLIMYKAYNKMSMKQEANEAMWMLEQNFPDYHKTN